MWVFERKFVLALVGLVDDLVEVLRGRLFWFGVIQVDTIVAEVVGSSVSGVDHVGSLNQIKGCGGDGLGPDHFCVLVVVM